MKIIIPIAFALTLLGLGSAHSQALRCPIGYHRNIIGRCVPNFIQGRAPMMRHHGPMSRRPQMRGH
jgi:hypothetical protein